MMLLLFCRPLILHLFKTLTNKCLGVLGIKREFNFDKEVKANLKVMDSFVFYNVFRDVYRCQWQVSKKIAIYIYIWVFRQKQNAF